MALLALAVCGCAPAVGAGGGAAVADGASLDVGTNVGTDAGAAEDVPVAVFNLPPGPVLELKANKDYLGAALMVIQSAQTQLDITEFETTNGSYLTNIVGALKAAVARGVQVRQRLGNERVRERLCAAALRPQKCSEDVSQSGERRRSGRGAEGRRQAAAITSGAGSTHCDAGCGGGQRAPGRRRRRTLHPPLPGANAHREAIDPHAVWATRE